MNISIKGAKENNLKDIDVDYENFGHEGVLVKPTMKQIAGSDIYYLQKEGPYTKIYEYGLEIASYFEKLPKETEFITVFEEPGYKPVKSKYKVGVVRTRGMEIKKQAKNLVQRGTLPPYKALVYTYTGSPSLLSFHWKQLQKYAEIHKVQQNHSLPFVDIEIYKRNGFIEHLDADKVITEMHLPIK